MNRTIALSALLLLTLAAPARAQDDADRLAALIEEALDAPTPTLHFLGRLTSLGDCKLDAAGVRRALAKADPPAASPIRQILAATTAIEIAGGQMDLRRSEKTTITMPGGGAKIMLEQRVKVRTRTGGVSSLGGDDRDRLRKADGDYTQFTDIDGIKVGEAGGNLYKLYDLFMVEEGGVPVVHIQAGVSFYKKWKRLAFPKPAATAAATAAAPPSSAGIVGALASTD